MNKNTEIHELDSVTINQIAAGEVVERPSNVVKELVENAIDSGAGAVTVEIRGGGVDLIRVTDDGDGIKADQIRNAFLRHATSKLSRIEDLFTIASLGFRGEALSSIAAVAQVDMITKTANELSGIRYTIEGGQETGCEEIGAPDGTTIIVRNLFFNTPARKKFLKKPQTEGAYVGELMERLALDNPSISFHFINNKQEQFHTTGNGDLKEIIYRIYGKSIVSQLIPFSAEYSGMKMEGYLGKPAINRSNRSFELFFVNGRYIHDKIISGALEEGYSQYLMQHKFPFAVFHIMMEPDMVDINVHPSKMEVHFNNQSDIYEFVRSTVSDTLGGKEMIPEIISPDEKPDKEVQNELSRTEKAPEPFEKNRLQQASIPYNIPSYAKDDTRIIGNVNKALTNPVSHIVKADEQIIVEKNVQLNMFDEKMLSKENSSEYKILGQIFETYWIIVFHDKLFIVDQHAAHEKVNYERMLKKYHESSITSQLINPPVILSLTQKEEILFLEYRDYFEKLGFRLDNFGGHEYAMREIPTDLYGTNDPKEMFDSILDELVSTEIEKDPEIITSKIASMACKASVKGNSSMTEEEMKSLIDEMLTLDNPYNCPHGRPTIISVSKYEIDKKFKRIV